MTTAAVMALQRTAGNRAVVALLQRRVVRLDGTAETNPNDAASASHAAVSDSAAQYLAARDVRRVQHPKRKEETQDEREERKQARDDLDAPGFALSVKRAAVYSAKQGHFLRGLGEDEKLYLVAHGRLEAPSGQGLARARPTPAVAFGGYTPEDLADLLAASGLPKHYRGRIYLEGCNTAAGSGKSFASRFAALLASLAPEATVKANLSPSHVTMAGRVEVKGVPKEGADVIEQLVNETLKLSSDAPSDFSRAADLRGALAVLKQTAADLGDLPTLQHIVEEALDEFDKHASDLNWQQNLYPSWRSVLTIGLRGLTTATYDQRLKPIQRPPERQNRPGKCAIS